ncbi:BMP family protein [Faecalimonas sp.]
MKKLLAILLCGVLTASMLVGCGSKSDKEKEKMNDGKLKVALCVTGAVNDMGWCQSAYEGLKLVEKDLDCEVAYTENIQAADMVSAFKEYAANDYDVVIGHGFQFGDPALEVSELYPDTKFICIEANASAENVASYVMKCEETGYLQGMLAAGMSKAGKVGFIGPVQGASLVKIMNGYEDGAKEVNPSIDYQTAWTGSFTDTALAKEAAQAMIDNGVDVIGHCANEAGTGALNVAQDAGLYATGDSYDQSSLAEKAVLSSAVYHVPELIKTAVSDIKEGKFKGEVKELGMAEGIVEFVYNEKLMGKIPQNVKEMLDKKQNAIKDGSFKVPCDTKERKGK